MSRLNEYNPEFGVVFETDWEKEWAAFQAAVNGGGSTTGGGTTTKPGTAPTFAQSSLQDKTNTLAGQPGIARKEDLIAKGGREVGNTIFVGNEKYSLRGDGTGLYSYYGTANRADQQALASQMMAQGVQNRTGAATAGITPEARPYAGNAGQFGTLGAGQGPTIPGFDAYRQAGIGIPSEGRRTIGGVENGLNVMAAGRQGSATQVPVAPGFRREGEYGNNINFASGSTGTGTLQPQNLFADTSVNVPGSYVYGQGNTNDANRAYEVPFNIGGGGAALMNIGGNNVQLNSADRSTGYGFALNAMPASNVFALTGRNGSEDPASQAAQILMLNSAIAQGRLGDLMATNPNQFGGYRAGTGNGPFSGNGGMGQGTFWSGYTPDPLGSVPTPSVPVNYGSVGQGAAGIGAGLMNGLNATLGSATAPPAGGMIGNTIANTIPGLGAPVFGPAFGSDAQAAAAYAAAVAAAQEERDRQTGGYGGGFDRSGDWSPFTQMAGGGRIAVRPLGVTSYAGGTGPKSMVTNGPKYLIDAKTGKIEALMGEDNADPGFAPNRERLTFSGPNNSMLKITPLEPFAGGGFIQSQPQFQQDIYRPMSYEEALRHLWFQPTPMMLPGVRTFDTGGTVTTTPDPLDPSIIAPWQQEQQANAQREAVRNRYLYRNKAAGIEGPTAIDVVQGNAPTNELAPNMYYSTDKQVNAGLNQLLGLQSDIRQLGPEIDTTPLQDQIGQYGIQLDTQGRLRDMETQRVGLQATNELAKAEALAMYNTIQPQIGAVQNALFDAQQVYGISPSPENYQRILDIQSKLAGLQADSSQALARSQSDSPALIALQAQQAALAASLPEGFNEASTRTELERLRTRVANNDKRVQKGVEVENLRKVGVPRLNAPIIPVGAAA